MLFVETSEFTRHLQSHLDDDGYAALQALLSVRPDVGDVIPGSGGIRKIRGRSRGRGKQGGIRVVYYWLTADDHSISVDAVPQGRQGRPDATRTGRVAQGRRGYRE